MKRIQRKRVRGWRMPENSRFVGRGTKYGNPYRVVKFGDGYGVDIDNVCLVKTNTKREANERAVLLYEEYFISLPNFDELVSEIAHYDALACWCALDMPCHADALIRIVKEHKGE